MSNFSASKSTIEKLDRERLFGAGVDLFKNYYIVKGIGNILATIGVNTSSDNDWFRAVAQYITTAELSALYDKILSPESRRNLAESSKFRTPPELADDDPDDILQYLSRNVLYRKKMWRILHVIYQKRTEEYAEALKNPDRQKSAMEIRFNEMKELFDFSENEVHAILTILLAQTRAIDFGDFDVCRFRSNEKVTALAKILGILDVEAAALMDDKNNIRKYGLVDEDLDLDRTFIAYLSGISSRPLAERFWVEYTGEALPWNFYGLIAEKHGEVLKKMIQSKSDDLGISVLLHGVAGSGKSSFAMSLAKELGKKLYFIAQNDESSSRMSYSPAFRYAALSVAQKQLPKDAILVVDEADRMLENTSVSGGFLARFFGDMAGSRDGESKGQLNSVLDSNKHTILWICNSRQEAIDLSSRRRFDYSLFWDDLSSTARCHIWHNALKFYNSEDKLTEEFIKRVSSRYPVNPGGISLAVKNASMVAAKNPDADFEQEVMTFLKAHCSLLGIQEAPEEVMEPARDYSLEGVNIRSGIKLPRLVEACKTFLERSKTLGKDRDQPRMNLLLFGVPGAGKTEFVKYLARELNKKLSVKNASDLLNAYVGGTEQRIASAFAEAQKNDEILFIDEVDSLLSSREGAIRSWEVSQVNTLLAEMEKFKGIFIVGTNLIQKLDPAALRRFSFRLHFDYLTNEGKEIFFNTYFTKALGMPELTGSEKEALFAIDSMTPSDFRNVRQQFFYLDDKCLTNMEVIEALETEIASKKSDSSFKGLGNVVSKMGF